MSRRRFAYTLGGVPLSAPVEVSEDYRGGDSRQPVFTDRYMEGTRSPVDGSDIGSRSKRREHMRVHGLADAADFKGEWGKAAERREGIRSGRVDKHERREQIARAMERKS